MAVIQDLAQDTRYTVRQLRRAPFFSITVMLTLAVSLGAMTALVSVLRATLLNPLPYARPGQLMMLSDANSKDATKSGATAVLRTRDLAEARFGAQTLFSDTGYLYGDETTIAVDGHEPVRVPAVGVSGGFFNTLGTAPQLGRALEPKDDVGNAPQVMVLSDHLWRSMFAADPAVIGKVVRMGAAQATIVGVMPRQFNFPNGMDMWHPGHVTPSTFGGYRGDGSRFVTVIGRLAPGVTEAQAAAQLKVLSQTLAHAYPATDSNWHFDMVSLRTVLFGEYRQALWLLSAAIAVMLLLTSVNIAGMQLSRNAVRGAEFAVRGALGISRARLLRQLLTESLLLVLAGGLLGIALAYVLLQILVTRLPAAFLRVDVPHLDFAVMALALSVAALVGLGTAVVPALQASKASASFSTRIVDTRTRRFGPVFTGAQIALALVLLTVSASLLQNLYRLMATPLGFDPAQVQTFSVDLPWGVDAAKAHRLYAQLEQQFAAMPGVEAAGYSNGIPLTVTYTFRNTFDVVGRAATPQHDTVIAEGRNLSPGYLAAMRIPLLRGRSLTAQDEEQQTPAVVMVNQAFVQKYFAGGEVLGKHLRGAATVEGAAGAAGVYTPEIVGVAGNVQGTSGVLGADVQPEVYFPANTGWPHMHFALRTALPAAALLPQINRLVRAQDGTATVGKMAPLQLGVAQSFMQPLLNAGLLTAFAGVSLLLVIIGVYGLVAFDVAQRTRELGLRLALGSSRRAVLQLLLLKSVRMLAVGLVLGVAGSVLAHRALAALLAQTPPTSVSLLLALAAVLAGAVLAATWLPARAAANLDPILALKSEG